MAIQGGHEGLLERWAWLLERWAWLLERWPWLPKRWACKFFGVPDSDLKPDFINVKESGLK